MTPNLHCTRCAFICTGAREGAKHVTENPTHIVTGEGSIEGSTVTIRIEGDFGE